MFVWLKKLFIPKGFYCYQILKIIPDKQFGFRMKVSTCPFYRHLHDIEGVCALTDDIIDDECKTCGLNDFTDKELERMEKRNK
jgi:hypothetical protein